MWVIENPATGLLKTARSWSAYPGQGGRHLLQVRTPYKKQTRLWSWRPSRGLVRHVGGREALKGGLDSWGVSVRGLGGSCASCFIAFLRRCARRLRARPRQSLRIGRASRTEARGISYKIFLGLRNFTRNSTRATRKKRDMPVSSSELYAGHQPKIGWCLSPVPRPKKPERSVSQQ